MLRGWMDKTLLERELERELELADKLERARATGSEEEIVIDLDGPGGNVFYIIGIISRRLRAMGRGDGVAAYRKEAMTGAYDELLEVSKRWGAECGVRL